MNQDRKRQIDRIFTAALDLPASRRPAFLDEQCRGDPQLRSRLEALLSAAERADELFAGQVGLARDRLFRSLIDQDEADAEDLSGEKAGAWLLERQIARGGLATVYLARRIDGAFEQKSAFKVLRRGLDTDDLVRRFRAERQILSSLEHPSIAKILDGGALPNGRPYLVLQFVDGLPITDYCRQNRVDIHGQVRLLVEVLRALHHAHTRGVIHRDVKPSNILVTREGALSLLDFGIAKLLDPAALPGGSTLTRTGIALLSPGYGSPEQVNGEAVTTASDIYQSGGVLYELLTGQRPAQAGPGKPVPEFIPPSKLLRDANSIRRVRGDLDAIVRKAMHPDPAQRYSSADEMVNDLERYLEGRPVTAQPDRFLYQLKKAHQRKPWVLPVLMLASLGILAYAVTLTVYSQRLAREERLAQASQQFLVDLLRSPDPYAPADAERGRNITVVEALELGEQRVRAELEAQPELKASLLVSISDVYASLDQNQAAIDLRDEALKLERSIHGNDSKPALISLRLLGGQHQRLGDLERAAPFFSEQLALARRLYPAGDPEVGVAEISSALFESARGDLAASRSLLDLGMDKLRAAPDDYAQTLIDALIESATQHGTSDLEAALAEIEEADRRARSAFGPDSVQAATVHIRLASSLTLLEDYENSERHFLAAIPVLEAKLGPEHASTLAALNNLGYLYHRRAATGKAEEIHRTVLERQIAKHGPVHRAVADSYQNLGGAITHQGRFDEAIPLHRNAYEIFKQVLNDDHYVIAIPLLSIAYGELQRGDAAASEAAAREALTRFRATVGGSFLEGVARCLTGLSLESQGQVAEGSALVESSHALMRSGAIPDPYPELCRLPGAP